MVESTLRRENSDSARNFGRLTCTFRLVRLPNQLARFSEVNDFLQVGKARKGFREQDLKGDSSAGVVDF